MSAKGDQEATASGLPSQRAAVQTTSTTAPWQWPEKIPRTILKSCLTLLQLMLRTIQAATLLLAPTCLLSSAKAIDIISNFPSNDLKASDIDSTFSKALGFTMPSGVPYTLDSATVSLYVEDLGAQSVWRFDLFADTSGNPDMAAPLVSLSLPSLALGDANYVLTPASSFTLQPNTTYWLVGASSSATSFGGWNRNDPSKTPSGLALSAGARSGNPPINANLFFNSYAIQATPVPGPLPILGAGAAFGASRALRKRQRGGMVWRRP